MFGSNKEGLHGGGAARIAYEEFGAEWGVGVGITGQCYAIPTMDGRIDIICKHVDDFTAYAKEHPELTFQVTRIGCGIAGWRDSEIAPLLNKHLLLTMSHSQKSSGMQLDYDGGFSNQDDFSLMENLPMVLLANPSVLLHALSLAESL